MPDRLRLNRNLSVNQAQFKAQYYKIAIASLLGILLYKLFPYEISIPHNFSLDFIASQFKEDGLTSPKDFIELLISLIGFALLSFGLTGILRTLRSRAVLVFGWIFLTSVVLSTTTEIAQAILPSRNPNVPDILTDSLGAVLGWFCFYQWRFQLLVGAAQIKRNSKLWLLRNLALPNLATIFVGYLVIATIGMFFLPFPTDLSNWDDSFPLMLGNERTGDRSWEGSIAQVQIYDRALSTPQVTQLLEKSSQAVNVNQDALLASYQFAQATATYRDRVGNLPDLVWQGKPATQSATAGIPLSSKHWLKSSAPVTYLNQRVRQNTELTFDLTIASASLEQRGPARILSVSQDPSHRNFTVGQDGKNLVVRLRTPMTGDNGSNPQFVVPNVFTDARFHRVIATYQNAGLQIYVDTLQNLHTFHLPYLGYKLLYYGLVFVPLGSLLGMILVALNGKLVIRFSLLFAGLLIPPVLLEGLWATTHQRDFALDNVGISLGFLGITVWLTQRALHRWLRWEFSLANGKCVPVE